jgi:hypothetical protein
MSMQVTNEESRQFCIYSYINATGHIIGTNKPVLGWKYFSDELPDIDEDFLDPLTYEALHLDNVFIMSTNKDNHSHDVNHATNTNLETDSLDRRKSPINIKKLSLDFAVTNNLLLSSRKLCVPQTTEQNPSTTIDENSSVSSNINDSILSDNKNDTIINTLDYDGIDNNPKETKDPLYICVATETVPVRFHICFLNFCVWCLNVDISCKRMCVCVCVLISVATATQRNVGKRNSFTQCIGCFSPQSLSDNNLWESCTPSQSNSI